MIYLTHTFFYITLFILNIDKHNVIQVQFKKKRRFKVELQDEFQRQVTWAALLIFSEFIINLILLNH